jgi:hypothetical protein
MIVYVLFRTAEMFTVRTWGPPLITRLFERVAEAQNTAASELGHQPTPQEFGEYMLRRREERQSEHRARKAAEGTTS